MHAAQEPTGTAGCVASLCKTCPFTRRFYRVPFVLLCCVASIALWTHRAEPWLMHFFSNERMWDHIHLKAADKPGGVWGYTKFDFVRSWHIKYLMEKKYSSILDVASNLGFQLSLLSERNPHAMHYGFDISPFMVNQTQSNCRRCVTAQFDLSMLQQRDSHNLVKNTFMVQGFDFVLVSDVLLYIHFRGVPAIVQGVCSICREWTRLQQRTFFENLAKLAFREVVISGHQFNPFVIAVLKENGIKHDNMKNVWIINGTAQHSS